MGTRATLVGADEFAARYAGEEHKRTELVRGEVRMMTPASGPHGRVCTNVLRHVDRFADEGGLGACFDGQTGFRLPIPDREGETVRSPDVSFVRAARLGEIPSRGFVPFAPDLVVEVLSPDETATEVQERLADYLGAGTTLVWIVDWRRRTVAVHSSAAATRYLREGDTLEGGEVLPGFAVPVAAFFKGVPTD